MRHFVAQSLILLMATGCAEQLREIPVADESGSLPVSDDAVPAGPAGPPPAVPGLITQTGKTAELKLQMSDVVAQARPFLDRAESMKGRELPRGKRINQDICDSIEKKITAGNPQRRLELVMCRDSAGLPRVKGGAKVFFSENVRLRSLHGVEVSHLLQSIDETVRETFHVSPAYSMESILLDSEYRIIETSRMVWEGKGRQDRPTSYRIASTDSEGNRYAHDYQTNGRHSIAQFTSSDGTAVFTRSLRPRSARARSKGQDLVQVLGFELSTEAGYERMSVYAVNGIEVCTEGSSLSGNEWTGYPSATATHGLCSNDW